MFSINSSATCTLRAPDTLTLTALAVMLWRIGVELQFQGRVTTRSSLLLVFCGAAPGRPAIARNAPQGTAQYRNGQLIERSRQTRSRWTPWKPVPGSAAHDIRQPVHVSACTPTGGSERNWCTRSPRSWSTSRQRLPDSLFDLVRLTPAR
jgi:hypothetical protein